MIAALRVLDRQHAQKPAARGDGRDVDAADSERRQVACEQLCGAPVVLGVIDVDGRSAAQGGEQVGQLVAVKFHPGRVILGGLVEAILAQQSGAVGAEPPYRHPLGPAGRGRVFHRAFQAFGLGALGRPAGARQLDEGPRAGLERAVSARSGRNAPLGCNVAPGQQSGQAGDEQHDDDRHDEGGQAAVGDEAHEVGLGHDDQDDPVAVGQHAHRFGRDDDAPVAEIEDLAAIALDAQPVVDAFKHGIAQLVEHRRLDVRDCRPAASCRWDRQRRGRPDR